MVKLGMKSVSMADVSIGLGMKSVKLGDNRDDGGNEIDNSEGLGDDGVDIYELGTSDAELGGHRRSEKSICWYYDEGMSGGGCNIDFETPRGGLQNDVQSAY